MTDAEGHWLAGLVDGEGCFFLSTNRTRTARGYDRLYRVLTFEFKLALRADDIATVTGARDLLGVGTIRVNKRGGRTTSTNAKPQARLVVYAREDIPRIIDFFTRYPLRSKKARDFVIWATAFGQLEEFIRETPLTNWSHGRKIVLSGKRRRFKTIPDELWAVMDKAANELRETRQYR
jgi:hypothetical protein